MTYFLGIDGGATTTRCAIGDAGRELARATGPSAKLSLVGEETARAVLGDTIRQACRAAGIPPQEIESTTIGATGAASVEVVQRLRKMALEFVGGHVGVVGDMVIAREAAFSGGPGVVVIAGTGSIAYGENENRHGARAGGWGPLLSDEGSGDWIGRAAVRSALRAADTDESSPLLLALQDAWQVSTRDALVARLNAPVQPAFAAFFPRVLATAESGDRAANSILRDAGRELARLAEVVVRKLWLGAAPVGVAMAGGIFERSAAVRDAFRATLLEGRPNVSVAGDPVDPLSGALFLARRAVAKAERA